MPKARTLNPIDLVKYKKKFKWGKHYYGLFDEKNELRSYLSFGDFHGSKYLTQIISTYNNQSLLLKAFIEEQSQKDTRYFLRELDERSEAKEFELMQGEGFKRYNRNYYFLYDEKQLNKEKSQDLNNLSKELKLENNLHIICKESFRKHIDQIIDIDISSQLLEYRDYLHKSKGFVRRKLNDIYVFVDVKQRERVFAFAFKKKEPSTFEFVIHPSLANLIGDCIEAFAEYHIVFDKNHMFEFCVNENSKVPIEMLRENFEMTKSTQMLIAESNPKTKSRALNPIFFAKQATT